MKYIILIFTNLIVVASLFLNVATVQAAGAFPDICTDQSGKPPVSGSSFCKDSEKAQDPNGPNSIYGPGSISAKATSLVALVVGIASVIMIIIGGIKFTLSGGDSSGVNSARNTILYALIGLVIAVAAQSIVVFVINKL